MTPDLVIGIDSSTSASKAIAWDRQGRAVAEGRASIALSNPQPGYFEQDPAEWWSSTAAALSQLTEKIDPARIAALAISNQRETFGLFREDGSALRPGTVWLDVRAKAQLERLCAGFGAARVHDISGKPADVTPCLCRMIWHRETEPKLFAETRRIAEVHGYLVYRLTGDWATSTASACPTGALDMRRRAWSSDLLAAAGIDPALMPRLVEPGAEIGAVSAAAAAATGLKAGTPVIAGGGDGQCAGTGAGVSAAEPGRAYVNLGTAVVSGSFGRGYAHDPAFRTMIAMADEGYIYETVLRSGTFLVEWLTREVLRCEPAGQKALIAALEVEAAQSPIGAHGLVMVPYWQGVMTPHWDPVARGIVVGLSGSTKRGDIYRALLESIALEQANSSALAERASGVPIENYVAIGGGAASNLWAQILADATGRPVHRSDTVEASSLGAAIAAAKGAGWYRSFADGVAAMAGKPVKRFDPDSARHARYRVLRDLQAELWPTLAAWTHKMADFVEQA
jgi:xylulokinase